MTAPTEPLLAWISGGKDSVAMLEYLHRQGHRMVGVFMYVVEGLSFQEAWLQWVESRYEIKVLRLPGFVRAQFLRRGVYCPPQPDIPAIRQKHVEEDARRRTGLYWCAYGYRMQDSLQRRGMIRSGGVWNRKTGRYSPLAQWTTRQVMRYIKAHRLRMSPESAMMGVSWGGAMWHRDLLVIRAFWPDDYARIRRDFPYVEALFHPNRMKNIYQDPMVLPVLRRYPNVAALAARLRDGERDEVRHPGGGVQPEEDQP
jgi:phosphoadenosine phosphosulfate reductase